MLRPRLIVFLMLEDGYIKKSKLFSNSRYLGDPLNAVQIYSDLNVDELIILDVNATNHNKSPNYDLLKNIGSIARMPLCYGGGIKDISQIDKIIRCGIEKISISSEVFSNKELIKQASKKYGSQSIVCCIDTKLNKSTYEYEIFVNRGQLKVSSDIKNTIKIIEDCGAGEIIINNISHDGTYQGYDLNLLDLVINTANIPISFAGGLSSMKEIKEISAKYPCIGITAGSIWSFLGKNGPVLINYPSQDEKKQLFNEQKK